MKRGYAYKGSHSLRSSDNTPRCAAPTEGEILWRRQARLAPHLTFPYALPWYRRAVRTASLEARAASSTATPAEGSASRMARRGKDAWASIAPDGRPALARREGLRALTSGD